MHCLLCQFRALEWVVMGILAISNLLPTLGRDDVALHERYAFSGSKNKEQGEQQTKKRGNRRVG